MSERIIETLRSANWRLVVADLAPCDRTDGALHSGTGTTSTGRKGRRRRVRSARTLGHDQGFALVWYLVPVAAVAVFTASSIAIAASLAGAGADAEAARAEAISRKLKPYWTVRPGQTYTEIARKTGLSIEQLETFNPRTNPGSLVPGQRIKLRLHVPRAPSKPVGPRYRTIRAGESFGSVAAATGHEIGALRRLNPRLKATALQPGDRMRLRR